MKPIGRQNIQPRNFQNFYDEVNDRIKTNNIPWRTDIDAEVFVSFLDLE